MQLNTGEINELLKIIKDKQEELMQYATPYTPDGENFIDREIFEGAEIEYDCLEQIKVKLEKNTQSERLNTDNLIELAETGKVKNIELDDMAKEVFSECAYMMKFERDCYLKGKKKNGRLV